MADQTEQTTLVHNEEETFALEPIDITGNDSEVCSTSQNILDYWADLIRLLSLNGLCSEGDQGET